MWEQALDGLYVDLSCGGAAGGNVGLVACIAPGVALEGVIRRGGGYKYIFRFDGYDELAVVVRKGLCPTKMDDVQERRKIVCLPKAPLKIFRSSDFHVEARDIAIPFPPKAAIKFGYPGQDSRCWRTRSASH